MRQFRHLGLCNGTASPVVPIPRCGVFHIRLLKMENTNNNKEAKVFNTYANKGIQDIDSWLLDRQKEENIRFDHSLGVWKFHEVIAL